MRLSRGVPLLVRWESKKAEGALRGGLRIWASLGARVSASVRLGLGSAINSKMRSIVTWGQWHSQD